MNSKAVAAKVDSAGLDADKLTIIEAAKRDASYRLEDAVHTNSRDSAAHTVTCTGVLDVTVMDTTANKVITFSVTQSIEGKTSISVDPFMFKVLHED